MSIQQNDWRAAMPEVKRKQAREADHMAAIAAGVGEYEIANACYRLAAILRLDAQGDYSSRLVMHLADDSEVAECGKRYEDFDLGTDSSIRKLAQVTCPACLSAYGRQERKP